MVLGALILLVGIVIGYFLRPIIFKEEEVVKDTLKKLTTNQKGIVVDLTPPVDLGDTFNEKETAHSN